MRTHGTLTRFNADRGFGFITPAGQGEEVFVHISAFERGAQAPRIGELISFETEAGPDGRLRAIRIIRAGAQAGRHAPSPHRRALRAATSGFQLGLGRVMLLMLLTGGAAFAYQQRDALSAALTPNAEAEPAPPLAHQTATPAATPASPRCDGRTHCSQMHSCADATYVLQHCPNTQMDGDRDGVPCEQQWCR
ncbi:cold shock domain-containing protein [Xanthomonas sp. NCPPB 1638]|uniref:cold shock domain-containing protein n=1 Tax=Xanthomonas TaxID=338 RepID=UPI00132F16C0|nr:cold shock domain-containing protein [Xanthomonas cucurbitae]QHG87749.1 cold-shock protein [Xanthomonas cucurbitae]WDM74367.1 cold shock domain-containing protein [Xanthomonas cucurbitae]